MLCGGFKGMRFNFIIYLYGEFKCKVLGKDLYILLRNLICKFV